MLFRSSSGNAAPVLSFGQRPLSRHCCAQTDEIRTCLTIPFHLA